MGYLEFLVHFYLKSHARVVKFSYLNFASLNLYSTIMDIMAIMSSREIMAIMAFLTIRAIKAIRTINAILAIRNDYQCYLRNQ